MKYQYPDYAMADETSHPARGAWIEIFCRVLAWISGEVAPRKGCVD